MFVNRVVVVDSISLVLIVTFSLSSPSSLLKLPIMSTQRFLLVKKEKPSTLDLCTNTKFPWLAMLSTETTTDSLGHPVGETCSPNMESS